MIPQYLLLPTWFKWLLPVLGLLLLALCSLLFNASSPEPPPVQIPLAGHQIYRLKWLDQPSEDEEKPLILPTNGTASLAFEFADLSIEPIPEGALLVLYLHKNRALKRSKIGEPDDPLERAKWPSIPGAGPNWFDSLFKDRSWQNEWVEMEDGAALQVAMTNAPFRLEEGKPVYRFQLTLNGNNLARDKCEALHQYYEHEIDSSDPTYHYCREDFGVALLGETEWLISDVKEEGGQAQNSSSELGYTNAWTYIDLVEIPPWWLKWLENRDLLAFLFVCCLWLAMFPLSSSRFVQGFLFIIGLILLLTVIGWLSYRFLFDATLISKKDFDLAKRQAVLRMSLEWEGEGYLQPLGCDDSEPQITFPDDLDLEQISRKLEVAMVPCPASTWPKNQPGIIMTWNEIFGTQTYFIFAAPWRLYQDNYLTLGRPTSQPRLISEPLSAPQRIAQDFGISQRIIYEQKSTGGEAWIQKRKAIFWNIPNIFCIEGITAQREAECWQPTEAPADKYDAFTAQKNQTKKDWIKDKVPLGGLWAPLNVWKALFLSVALCVGFIMVVALVQFIWAFRIHNGCLGYLFTLFAILLVGTTITFICVTFAFSDTRHSLAEPGFPDTGSFEIPQGPIGILANQGLSMLKNVSKITTFFQKGDPSILVAQAPSLFWGGILGLMLMPVWLGMAVGGVMGGWIGVIVQLGLLIGGIAFAALPDQRL